MRIRDWRCSGIFRRAGRVFQTVAAASLIVIAVAAVSRAGDIVAQPADGLNVTNSVPNLLPQAGAAPAAGPEASWLSGLHISGYGSQTFGMWQNPTNLRAYTLSRNNLAVARSLLQLDENYRLNENNTFFMREWFVYEPPYSWNSANIGQWDSVLRFYRGFYDAQRHAFRPRLLSDSLSAILLSTGPALLAVALIRLRRIGSTSLANSHRPGL